MSCRGGCSSGDAAATVADPVPLHQPLPAAQREKKHADAMELAFCNSQGVEMAAWDVW